MTLTRESTRIGFVGLGNLGQAMALALLEDGWKLTVYDPGPGKSGPCAEAGGQVATTLRDVAGCDVLALAVPDDAAVEEVLGGGEPSLLTALPVGAVVLLHSTVLPDTVRRLAERAGKLGVGVLDAPVSGGAERARRGELTVMAGGSADAVERVRPVLESVGDEVRHVGPAGAGSAAKLANQLMMFAALAGTYEALDLAAAYGVAGDRVLAAVAGGTGSSWVSRNWGFFDRVADSYDEGGTPVRERPWSKDLRLVVAAAESAGASTPLAGLLAGSLADRVEEHARTTRTARTE